MTACTRPKSTEPRLYRIRTRFLIYPIFIGDYVILNKLVTSLYFITPDANSRNVWEVFNSLLVLGKFEFKENFWSRNSYGIYRYMGIIPLIGFYCHQETRYFSIVILSIQRHHLYTLSTSTVDSMTT